MLHYLSDNKKRINNAISRFTVRFDDGIQFFNYIRTKLNFVFFPPFFNTIFRYVKLIKGNSTNCKKRIPTNYSLMSFCKEPFVKWSALFANISLTIAIHGYGVYCSSVRREDIATGGEESNSAVAGHRSRQYSPKDFLV